MTPLRLLVVSHHFPQKQLAWLGVFLTRQARLLAAHGVQTHFLVPRQWAPWPLHRFSRWQMYGPANPLVVPLDMPTREVRYVRPPGRWFRRFETRALYGPLARAARRWHHEQPFDAILGVDLHPDGIAAVRVARDLGLPAAVLAIGSDVLVRPRETPHVQRELEATYPYVDAPMGVSQALCDAMDRTGRCRTQPVCIYLGRTKTLPLPDRESARTARGWRSDETVALYVGRLDKAKGIAELAEAATVLWKRYPSLRLVCIGDGPLRSDLQLAAAARGPRALELAGLVPPDLVNTYLYGADFLVLPSHSEGMPQAILEAMDAGLPIVATRVGGVPEAVLDGDTGLLIPPRDAHALEAAMEKMLIDEPFRRSAGAAARARAADLFDSERNAARMAKALKTATRRDRAGRTS